MNEFLKTRQQIDNATKWLKNNFFTTHPISAKDWELATVTNFLSDGDIIDLGANGSFVLHNAIKMDLQGRKVGIDLAEVTGDNKAEGAEYFVGDLMRTPFEDNSFDTVVSLSTIEHEVDFKLFAKECSRILKQGGDLIVSFDYWNPKQDTSGITLYGLKWNILDMNDFVRLVDELISNGLEPFGDNDLSLGDKVINPAYCSPGQVSYTFGIFHFKKL